MTTCTEAFDAQASLLRVRKQAPAQQLALLPAPRNPRYISLDIWRGAACLAVVLSHSMIYLGAQTLSNRGDQIIAALGRLGGWGVWLFFVISGYCIAATSDSTRRQPKV